MVDAIDSAVHTMGTTLKFFGYAYRWGHFLKMQMLAGLIWPKLYPPFYSEYWRTLKDINVSLRDL